MPTRFLGEEPNADANQTIRQKGAAPLPTVDLGEDGDALKDHNRYLSERDRFDFSAFSRDDKIKKNIMKVGSTPN